MKLIAICANMDPLFGIGFMNDLVDSTHNLITLYSHRLSSDNEKEEYTIRYNAYKLQYDVTYRKLIGARFINYFRNYPLDLYPRMIDLHKRDKTKYIHRIQTLHDSSLTLKIKEESLKQKIKDILSKLNELENQRTENNKVEIDALTKTYNELVSKGSDIRKKQYYNKTITIESEDRIESLERAIAFCEYFHKCAIYFKKLPVDVELTGDEPQEPDFHSAKFKAPQIRQILQLLHARLTQLERLHAISQ